MQNITKITLLPKTKFIQNRRLSKTEGFGRKEGLTRLQSLCKPKVSKTLYKACTKLVLAKTLFLHAKLCKLCKLCMACKRLTKLRFVWRVVLPPSACKPKVCRLRREVYPKPSVLEGSTRFKVLQATQFFVCIKIFYLYISAHTDSNRKPSPCKGAALPIELWAEKN